MTASAVTLDQQVIAVLMTCDPVVSEYRDFFNLLDWSQVPERDERRPWPGSPPHPQRAYVKALLAKICEEFEYTATLRRFLVKHPLLVLELGFRPVLDPNQPLGSSGAYGALRPLVAPHVSTHRLAGDSSLRCRPPVAR